VLNTVFIPVFASVLKIPQTVLMPLIMVLTIVGSYTLSNNMIDVWVMIIFGIIGYITKKYDYPTAPLILGLVLGPIAEINFVRAASLSKGDLTIFFTRPLSLTLLILAFLGVFYPLIKQMILRLRIPSARRRHHET
jgi:putative tricarboxylic transport membrane protein